MKSLPLSAALLLLLTACESTSEKKTAATGAAAASSAASIPLPSGRTTTASGLQYEVLKSGPAGGRSPTLYDSVTVHYHGTLTDGTVFDSSYDRGEPITLGVNQVIPGWTEALQLMKPGDIWMLYIPYRLGYGGQAAGKIPPYSDLTFKVEMLQVNGGR